MGLTPPKDQRGLWERTRDQVVTWFGDIKMFSPLPFLPLHQPGGQGQQGKGGQAP